MRAITCLAVAIATVMPVAFGRSHALSVSGGHDTQPISGARDRTGHPVRRSETFEASRESVTAQPAFALRADDGAGYTPSQRALVTWAEQRFVAAGLHPPEPEIVFSRDREPCLGHNGRYQHAINRVSFCVRDVAGDLVRREVMLHELAHAWAHASLSAADRDAFVELRAAASWRDHDDPWLERGTEHAADILAWGLMDVPVDLSHFEQSHDAALLVAFTQLTGVAPINDGSHPSSDPTESPVPPATRSATTRSTAGTPVVCGPRCSDLARSGIGAIPHESITLIA